VPISSIRELRLNQPPTDGYPAARWITVVYTVNNTQWKVLHMTALTDDVYDLWTKTLTARVDRHTTSISRCVFFCVSFDPFLEEPTARHDALR